MHGGLALAHEPVLWYSVLWYSVLSVLGFLTAGYLWERGSDGVLVAQFSVRERRRLATTGWAHSGGSGGERVTSLKDAKLVAIAVTMGLGTLVFTLFEIFASETSLIGTFAPALLPMAVVMIADLIGFVNSLTIGSEEVSE
jgi:hypothetical protein